MKYDIDMTHYIKSLGFASAKVCYERK